jgi:hypothetical protein
MPTLTKRTYTEIHILKIENILYTNSALVTAINHSSN